MKVETTTLIVALLHCTISLTYGSKILALVPHPGKSHFDFFRPLFRGLALAGHDMTVISYFPNKEPIANYTDVELTGMPIIANNIDLKIFENEQDLIDFKVPTFFMINGWGLEGCEAAFNSKAIKELLAKKEHYDVVLIEQFSNDCMMAIAHVLQAPVVALSSCAIMPWHYKRMGSPFIPSFMPVNFLPHTDEMTFFQRLNNFFHYYAMNFLYDQITQKATNEMIRKYLGDSIPPIEELVLNTNAMLINQHYSLTGSVPYAPGIVEIGGLQIQAPSPIDPDLKALLDASHKGVIYISWGSMIRPETLSLDRREALLRALSQFEETILMKWSNETLLNRPKNVYLRQWMPQREILCHPNVKVFLTHGGLLGTSESCHCGVPMVVTPIYGDQFLNSEAIKKRQIGTILRYKDMSEENIVKAIKKALSPEMQKNAKIIAYSFNNRPQTPLSLAIWWVEHVIQNKGLALAINESSNMSAISYNCLDIYAFLLVVILFIVWINKKIIKFCIALCKSGKSKKD
ncbi:UDP-glycosyltransferase UGT5-like isoform X2 [Eupeodes corollae]|nr:UDP-glycosyltransferase UGT5-like isoform X2 [Eupeodes corollae]